jgi:hypothetical protein
LNKPLPIHELVIEPSDSCERCLTLYALSEPARAFLKAECEVFGILKPVDHNSAPASILAALVGKAPAPAADAIVFSLHVWPNYDLPAVRTWIEAWPHVGEPFEQAIEEMQ